MDERLGTLLIQAGRIRPDQLEQALRRQEEQGGRLGTNLVELGALSLDALTEALAGQRGVPAATFDDLEGASTETLALLPAEQAARLLALPLTAGTAWVVVAAASPWDPAVAAALTLVLQRPVSLRLAPELRILEYLEKLYRLPNPRRKGAAAPAAAPDRLLPLGPGELLGEEESPPALPDLEPLELPLQAGPFSDPLASPLAPSLQVDALSLDALDVVEVESVPEVEALDVEEVLPGELMEEAAPPAAPPPPASPIARLKTPVVLGGAGSADPLAAMSWDLPAAPSAAPQPGSPPAATPAPLVSSPPEVSAPAPTASARPDLSPAVPAASSEPEKPAKAEGAAAEPASEVSALDVELVEEPAAGSPEPAAASEPASAAPAPDAASPGPAAAPEPASAVAALDLEPVEEPAAASPEPAALVEAAPEAPAPDVELAAALPGAARPPEPLSGASALDIELAEDPACAPLELAVVAPPPVAPAEAAPAVEEPAFFEPPPMVRPVTSLYLVDDALARATRPEKVVENLLWGCEGRFEAAAFFALDGKRARARDAFGPSGTVPFDDGFALDLAAESLVRSALQSRRPVLLASSSPSDAALCARMGVPVEGRAAAIPFLMQGSVVTVLWASCGTLAERPSLADEVDRLAEMGARAFGRLPWGFAGS